MSIQDIAAAIKDRVEAGSFDSIIKFDCGDNGLMVIDNQTVSTDDAEADCTVAVDIEDLKSIVDGELDPTSAFMQGKLKVDGDMGVAMKLGQVL